MNPFCSIRSRLLGLVLAAVIPLAALILAGVSAQYRIDHAAVAERAITEARLLAAQVDDHISDIQSMLAVLGQTVSTNPADRDANDALLRKVEAALPAFDSHLLLFAADGTNIGTSADPGYPRIEASDRTYFREAMAGHNPAVGDPILVRSGRWVVNIAQPIKDETGQVRAVLTVGPVLERFQNTLSLHALPEGSVVTIANRNGRVIAGTGINGQMIGRTVRWRHMQQRFAQGEGTDLSRWVHTDNIERISGFSITRNVPWLVMVAVPTAGAYAPLISRLKWSALIVIGTLAAAFAIAWLLSGHIVRPLRQLGKDASELAAGNLEHRSAVATSDEVGALAENFNQMAAAMERRRLMARKVRSKMRQAKDTFATIIDTSHVAIVCLDADHTIVLWSRGAEQMFGYSAEEVLGQRTKLVPPEAETEAQDFLRRAFAGETVREAQIKRRRKDGALLDVRFTAAPMRNDEGAVRSVAIAYEDITDRKRAEEQMRRLAHYDQLTGLPNRTLLQNELERLLTEGRHTSVVLFDLDEFKDVNDTLGHSTGDRLLVEVGRRLLAVAEERAMVGLASRLGGDEFVVVIPDCGDPRILSEIVLLMLKRLSEPFIINGQQVHLGASAGVAIAPNDGTSVDELIANADLALYQTKSDGGRGLRFFTPVLRAQAQARRNLGLELRRAFAQNELVLYFQPQIRLSDNAVMGAEALLRWLHPERGVVAPGAFIEALAESAIASDVGRWIIRGACERMAAWRAMGLPLTRVGVNLFPAQAYDEMLPKDIAQALKDFGLPAEALELEITENVALNREDSTVLQSLQEQGVKLAFDDFGTGYASLSYLTRFPLARIKIDRSFVGKITQDAQDAAIVRSLIVMAHNLDLGVIAEGVETAEQAEFLRLEGCEEAQGFLYSRPLPAGEFETYLHAHRLASPIDHDPVVKLEPPTAKVGGRHRSRRA